MCGMLVSATGGMSFAVGGLCALDAGAEVCGRSPVRTIGGCKRVDIAAQTLELIHDLRKRWLVPFCPDSSTELAQLPEAVSRDPPTEWMELAVDPLLALACDTDELCLQDCQHKLSRTRSLTEPYLWNAKSGRWELGDDIGVLRLSTDFRASGFENIVPKPHHRAPNRTADA